MKTGIVQKMSCIILVMILASCTSTGGKNEKVEETVVAESLPVNQVCMINDAFMGKDQIPVPVGNKVYYGCCEGCVEKLTNMEETRYGTDPLTGQKVDKADAFIVLNPQGSTVWYFASKENYLQFNNKQTNNM